MVQQGFVRVTILFYPSLGRATDVHECFEQFKTFVALAGPLGIFRNREGSRWTIPQIKHVLPWEATIGRSMAIRNNMCSKLS